MAPTQLFIRAWRVRNTGTSTWDGYKLIFLQGDQMGGASPVSVPTTAPGQEAELSVALQAPATAGNKAGYWQIVTRDGVHVSGGRLSVNINVVSATTGDHIGGFTADPPSPSSASAIRLNARVNWWPQFRAMRAKVDNQIIGETGAAEHAFVWDASSATRGAHTLVLEVADQTDLSWSHPERRIVSYTLEGAAAPANHAPARPTLSSPYDWYVYYSGNTGQLCAQANGDPDGDAVNSYYFDVYDSAQLWNSSWTGNNCVTTGGLGPYDYKWRVKVRDSRGAESEWSDSWHFTLVNPNLSISELYFQPLDSNSERVKIRTCTTGQGGIGITMRVSVNDANDGSANGQWHIVKELGVPCFIDADAPIWQTLEYGDGPHRVRSEAHGLQSGWNGATVREEVYTLPHRRPDGPALVAPVPADAKSKQVVYLNSRTLTLKWAKALRAQTYTVHVSTQANPDADAAPVFRQSYPSDATSATVTFGQDYPALYWQVTATNDAGTTSSWIQPIAIDRQGPSCALQALPGINYENVFQVTWSGADNLAGVRTFDVQYQDSGREGWQDWLNATPAGKPYELFIGQAGHTYAFRCRATDNAGNTGEFPATAGASTKVDPAARPQTPWWNAGYASKRNLTILNNMPSITLPVGYPVHLHFDGGTSPTAAELYDASKSATKCNDLRVIYNDSEELNRLIPTCTASAIDVWFRSRVAIAAAASNTTAHQLYYGNASAGAPPADANLIWYPYLEAGTTNLYYFQEGSGSTTYDYSGNGRNCAINPSVNWSNAKWGSGLHFSRANNGSTTSLTCGSPYPLSALTAEFWWKSDVNDRNTDGRLAGQLGPNNQLSWLVSVESDRLKFERWCNGGSQQARGTANIRQQPYYGQWNYLAVTFDGGNQVKFYINGTLDNAVTLGNSCSATYGIPLEIGSVEGSGQGEYTLGAFRLSNTVKTDFSPGAFANITSEPVLAAGAVVAPPAFGSPDLAILDLATYPNPGGGVLAQATVKNTGDRETQNGFYTDLYVDHVPTGAGDYTGSLRFWVSEPIAAGATAQLTTVLTSLTAPAAAASVASAPASESTGKVYAQVDSTGALAEPNKANNITAQGVDICVATNDAYESDDTAATAATITTAESQLHNVKGPGDADWLKFNALAGQSYVLQTSGLGPSADTYLYLYDTDGTTLLAANDDNGDTLASRIEWKATKAGQFYVLAQHWNPNSGGCGTNYTVSLMLSTPAEDTPTPTPAPTWTPVPGSIVDCPVAPSGMKLDGDLTEWGGRPAIHVDKDTAATSGHTPRPSPSDLSGDAFCGWDGDDLVFAGRLLDDSIKRDSTNIWDDDGMELGLDGLSDGFTWGAPSDHQFTIASDGTIKDLGTYAVSSATIATRATGGGWAYELRLPASVLNIGALTAGRGIRVNVGLNDDDDGGSRDDWLMWRGSSTNSHSEAFGTLMLTGSPSQTPTFTPVPTATFTPVPTATFTPVPTATFTPVPTATFTLVPTATFTPVPTPTNTPAVGTTVVKIVPATKTLSLAGGAATVELSVENVVNLGGFQTELLFDPTVVSVSSVSLGTFLGSSGRSVAPVGPTIDNLAGKVSFGAFTFGTAAGPSGSGTLATITMLPKAAGTTSLRLQATGLSDPGGASLAATTQNGQVQVTSCLGDFNGDHRVDIFDLQRAASHWNCKSGDSCYDVQYDVEPDGDIDIFDLQRFASVWGNVCGSVAAVRQPRSQEQPETHSDEGANLSLVPAERHVVAGDVFTETVEIRNAANLAAFQSTLRYNPAVLSVDAVTVGPFLGASGRTVIPVGPTIDNTSGNVTFGAFTFGAQGGVSGDGSVLFIRLRAKGTGESELTFQQPAISDPQGNPLTLGAATNGVVHVSAAENQASITQRVQRVAPGEVFTETLRLDGATGVGAFQVALSFDPTVLSLEAASLGTLLSSTGRTVVPVGPTIHNDTGRASYGGFTFGSQPGAFGGGQLALFRFRAQRAGTSKIDVQELDLSDPSGNPLQVGGSMGAEVSVGSTWVYLPLLMR